MSKQNTKDAKISFMERFQLWLFPWLIVLMQRLVGLTSRRINLGQNKLDQLRAEGNAWIYATWHTNALYTPYLVRNQNVAAMISNSKDGEYIARVVRRHGNDVIRGSTTRGSSRALISMIKHLRAGNPGGITPDGPVGPAIKLQPGVVICAQRSQVPIVPFHFECTRQWVLAKAWDQHRVPKPFTTFVVSYGEPIHIKADLDPEEFTHAIAEVERKLIKNMEYCRTETERMRKG